jgi:MscS family membrane protein
MQSRSNGLGDGPARLDWLRCHFRMKTSVHSDIRHAGRVVLLSLLLLFCKRAWPQAVAPKATTAPAPPEAPKDTLGRDTPRGAVLAFLNAARKGNAELAALYLNTSLRGPEAATLARQLAVVLNRRLPPRLGQISDKPEGSAPDPLRPDEDLVGSISTAKGQLDIMVERVDRGKAGKVWLFSRKTLSEIPVAFQELDTPPLEEILPQFMVKRVANIPISSIY